jgi:acetoin utilization protein AcuB
MDTYPVIKNFMTPAPISVGLRQTVEYARDLMNHYHIRHLPVVEGGWCVGLLTERDARLALSLTKDLVGGYLVQDVYLPEPYRVPSTERLDRVLEHMLENHIGSALVVDDGKLTGIFTTMDAVSTLREFIADEVSR